MPSITLKCPYGQNKMLMSPEELLETYFYGIKICGADGKKMSDEMIKFYITAATEEVEKALDLKIIPQIIDEQKDFWMSDYKAWGYIRVTYPLKKAHALDGFINDVKQIEYPSEWLSFRKTNDGIYFRNMYLVPTTGHAMSNSAVYSGITPHLGFYGNKQIPNYWTLQYCTGFDHVPKDLLNFIGKMASINIFHILGDIIIGAGIASQSIGIDGLNQSISTTSSATNAGYGARITGYLRDMKASWPKIKAFYKGFEMTSM